MNYIFRNVSKEKREIGKMRSEMNKRTRSDNGVWVVKSAVGFESSEFKTGGQKSRRKQNSHEKALHILVMRVTMIETGVADNKGTKMDRRILLRIIKYN